MTIASVQNVSDNEGEHVHRSDQAKNDVYQNLTFHDSVGGETVDYGDQDNWIAKADGTPSIQLGNFLSRPTRIASFSWSSASSAGAVINDINPWFLFLNDPVIKRKIENFAFIRGDLHMKVNINASPFYYGLARTFYSPLEGVTQFTRIDYTNGTSGMNSLLASQFPGVYILPHANVGGEIKAPFFYPQNWLDLSSASSLNNMGRLRTYIMRSLDTANGVASPSISVQIFAWMENVELMGPTISPVLQSGTKDEFVGHGQVSAPASALSKITSKMVDIPVIGRFAKATSIGASAVGQIASLWGYTNTPVIEDVRSVTMRTIPALASSEIGVALEKFTLDPKQELSIDPSLHGLPNDDELSLAYLLTKESLVHMAPWSTSDAPDALLFNARVEPSLGRNTVINPAGGLPAQRLSANTVQGYVAGLFQYWRGDIIFRVQIIGTKFHKGRLRISYDPVGEIGTNPDSINAVFTHVVDIGEENNIEFRIPWHQARAWKESRNLRQVSEDGSVSLFPLTQSSAYTNGLFTIRVMNALTAPTTSSTISIAVYMRGGENLEYAVPLDLSQQQNNTETDLLSFKGVQSGTKQGSVDTMENEITHVVVGDPKSSPHDKRYLQNFGEVIPSLRKLLRRSSLLEYIVLDDVPASSIGFWRQTWPLTTPVPGQFSDGIHASASYGNFNYVPMHPITFVRYMYAAWKGGMRYHIQLGPGPLANMDDVTALRISTDVTSLNRAGGSLTTSLTDRSGRASFLMKNAPLGAGASAVTATRTQTGLSFEAPYYSAYNFSMNTLVNNTTGPNNLSYDSSNCYGIYSFVDGGNTGATNTSQLPVKKFVSIAPDWNVHFFVATPTCYFYTTPTPAG